MLRLMNALKNYFVLSFLKGHFPLEVSYDQQNIFYAPIFKLYHELSLFIVGGSPHLVSEHFPWHKWKFFFEKKRGKIGWRLSHPFLKLFVHIQEK